MAWAILYVVSFASAVNLIRVSRISPSLPVLVQAQVRAMTMITTRVTVHLHRKHSNSSSYSSLWLDLPDLEPKAEEKAFFVNCYRREIC